MAKPDGARVASDSALDPDGLHPAVAAWFAQRFPDGPTEAQAQGWPRVASGANTLIAAPTGSGKTLAGFLMAIDAAYRGHAAGAAAQGTTVVYVSPLKALAVDIHHNLQRPLAEIAEMAVAMGMEPAPITVAVRTGDTPAGARAAMLRTPPTFLVTTPESLYLLLTARRSRAMLTAVTTVIVDEIHALARDKRGAHLALTLERLDAIGTGRHPQRIGLSATQRPIQTTGRLLVGNRRPMPAIVDCGHARALSVRIQLPQTELAAVASSEQLGEVLDGIAAHVTQHTTTLVFVNTRRMAERLAHMLGERVGADQVAAHHGSLSADRRQRTEAQLRAGQLRALVATASLELGIDVGPVELVCQIGSPRSIATFLQRVGRSNHSRLGVPEGILFPMTRDELVECAALMAAVRGGRLDATVGPDAPLDILAQQVIAEVAAAEECDQSELYELMRSAAPYASLSRQDFDAVVALAADGIPTGRGARMAYLHADRVNGMLRPRRGARLAALTSGGAIAEVGDYRVVAEPDDVTVGSVNEDFAIESMAGDVFLLGTHAWRVQRVRPGEVRVIDADGANPTIPFWVGEAPARTDQLSEEVSQLRLAIGGALARGTAEAPMTDERRVGRGGGREQAALAIASERCGLAEDAAEQLVAYLATAHSQLGALPNKSAIVFERFFDEAGGMQLVVHSPHGARINRAYGLALRKRFCVTFDFELQAAASDDALVLALGPQHSFPLQTAPALVNSTVARAALEQAVLVSPLFASRWRWNLNRALAVLRFRGGRRTPIQIQRMEADDVMAAVFPEFAGCQENAPPGPIEVPDHLLVRQTMRDTLVEAMDVEGLVGVLAAIESGEIATHFVDSTEPSVLAHEILNGAPYTFLDDAPLEERRSRAVRVRRGLPLDLGAGAGSLARLDPAAIARVRAEVTPDIRNAEELHDLLLSLVLCPPIAGAAEDFGALVDSGRAMTVTASGLWCATERRTTVQALDGAATFAPDLHMPAVVDAATADQPLEPDAAVAMVLAGHLDVLGPVSADQLATRTALPLPRIAVGLARLEADGFALRCGPSPEPVTAPDGEASDDAAVEQWCSRRLLARIHAYTQNRRRREIEPVSAQELMRFLAQWQHTAPSARLHGRAGVLEVVDRLQGFELAAGAWEESVFPARVEAYQERWLEDLCLSGEVVWGRLSLRAPTPPHTEPRRAAAAPSRATPITFALRGDLPWLLRAARGQCVPEEPAQGAARELLDALRTGGAMFAAELRATTGRMPAEVEEGLWDLVARGLVTADGFGAVRALFSARQSWQRARRHSQRHRVPGRRLGSVAHTSEGRWALLPGVATHVAADPELADGEALAEQVAGQLLARWGVFFWDLTARENLAVPWRELLWALRRLEARGVVRGGRFVAGCAGEQYALPEAVELLRSLRHNPRQSAPVRLSAADPLNLAGIVFPGARVPAQRGRTVTLHDGLLQTEPEPPQVGSMQPLRVS